MDCRVRLDKLDEQRALRRRVAERSLVPKLVIDPSRPPLKATPGKMMPAMALNDVLG